MRIAMRPARPHRAAAAAAAMFLEEGRYAYKSMNAIREAVRWAGRRENSPYRLRGVRCRVWVVGKKVYGALSLSVFVSVLGVATLVPCCLSGPL